MASRKVLTVNHVVQMLLHFHASKSWPAAILEAVPQRKGLQLKRGLGEVEAPAADVAGGGGDADGGSDCESGVGPAGDDGEEPTLPQAGPGKGGGE
jgi:hypothetical protein